MLSNLKIKSFLLILIAQLLCFSNSNATNNLAIKLDVTELAQDMLNDMKKTATGATQRHKFHCKVGFIEKIQSNEVDTIAANIQQKLQSSLKNPVEFEVKEVIRPFNSNIISFVPTEQSENVLKQFNQIVANVVQEVTGGRYTLNALTSTNYKPHISLANKPIAGPDNALTSFQNSLQTKKGNRNDGRFFLKLQTISYQIMK